MRFRFALTAKLLVTSSIISRMFSRPGVRPTFFSVHPITVWLLHSQLTMADIRLSAGTIKRPDASYGIRPRALPNPPPPWLKFQPNGDPYPNVVIEVEVNNESALKLKQDCHRYFRSTTSVCVWIGIKIWVRGRKVWIAWADRAATGNRGVIHTNMRLPPHHHSIDTPVNLVYHIPMATVYGNGITIPPNSPPTLNIDCDAVREVIEEYV